MENPNLSEDQKELILAYVESNARGKLHLSAEQKAAVDRLLAENEEARKFAEEETRLEEYMANALDVEVDNSGNEDLAKWILSQVGADADISGSRKEDDSNVVSFPAEATTPSYYRPLAWAASIAVLIAGGFSLYSFQTQQRLSQTVAQVTEERSAAQGVADSLQLEVAALTDARDKVEATLATTAAALGDAHEVGTVLEQQLALLESEKDQAAAERQQLQGQVAGLESDLAVLMEARDTAEAELARTAAALGDAREAGTVLEQQLALLENEKDQAVTDRDDLQRQVAGLESDLTALTDARDTAEARFAAKVQELDAALAASRDQKIHLADLSSHLSTAQEKLRDKTASLAARIAEREAIESRMSKLVADFALDQEVLKTRLLAAEGSLADAARTEEQLRTAAATSETNLQSALLQINQLSQANEHLLAEVEDLRLKSDWVAQVVGYHRGYAGTRYEVEISAEEQRNEQALTTWMKNVLGKDFTVPDLSGKGMTFVGGRVFFVNGVATGQFAYHDDQGRLTGFCLTPSEEGKGDAWRVGKSGRLNAIYWQKKGFQYVLVGDADPKVLASIAKDLHKAYGETI